MTKQTYTDEQRAEAVALYVEHGSREALRRMRANGVNVAESSIRAWAKGQGKPTEVVERKTTHIESNKLTMEARKQALAEGLIDDAFRLRAQLFEPATVHSFGGPLHDFVEASIAEPTFADKQKIMTSIAIAVDKIQLLTGSATSREEQVLTDRAAIEKRAAELDELAARRTAKGAA